MTTLKHIEAYIYGIHAFTDTVCCFCSTQSRGRNQAAKGAKSGQIYRLLLDQPEDMPNISGIPNTQADPSMLPDDFEEVGDYNYNENSGDFGNGQLGQLEYSDEFSLRPAESEKKQTPSQKRYDMLPVYIVVSITAVYLQYSVLELLFSHVL